MSSSDKNLQQVDATYRNTNCEACPVCGRTLDEQDRGAVDFYCPAPQETSNGN